MSLMSILIKSRSVFISTSKPSVPQNVSSVYEENTDSLSYVAGKQEYF